MRLLGPTRSASSTSPTGSCSRPAVPWSWRSSARQHRARLPERRHPGLLLSRAVGRGIGFSKLIATGNEADLDVSDLVDHLLEDEATAVIALYLEALRKPDRFRAVAAKAARMGKPIVAFKVGRSEAGSRSAASHTGALAGADRVYDALFRQIGVIRATTFADLLDIPAALAPQRRLRGGGSLS